ncbi:MAG: helix-turn-helix transcriptional regulator [Nanoarchaeota archaeon]
MEIQVRFVEAIESGKIVRVSEDYAFREGLPILRRPQSRAEYPKKAPEKEKWELFGIDTFRKPLKNKNNVIATLVDNFHWQISSKRKQSNMTRKQFAAALGVSEGAVKLIENGLLPSDDYVLISKVEQYLGINLRKDGKDYSKSAKEMLEKREENIKGKEENTERLFGDEIEIIE